MVAGAGGRAFSFGFVLFAATIGLAIFSSPASTAPADDGFYRDKTVTVFVGYLPAGNYAFYGRLLSQHLSKRIPGRPTVVVKYMPGAATLVLANHLYNVAPKDGTVIGLIQERMGILPLINPRGIKYDAMKLNWIGAMSAQLSVCFVWHTSTARTIDDAMRREVLVGGTNAGGSSSVFPRVLNETVGTRFKLVQGYPGTQDLELAMEREEIEGRCGYGWAAIKATKPDWVRDKKIRVLMQMGMTKEPELSNVPLILDRIADPQKKASVEFFLASSVMGRPFVAPPGVPAERVKILRDAFDATVRDPDFLAKAKVQSLEIEPMSGTAIQELLARLYSTPEAIVEPAREWLK